MDERRTPKDFEIVQVQQPNRKKKIYPNIVNMSKKVYLSDPTIIPRIEKYMDEKINMHYIDINDMADELQQKFPKDYGKRKRTAFRSLVRKAYGLLMKTYDNSQYDNSSEDMSDASDEPVETNPLNTQLLEMYTRNATPVKPIMDNELIDISSDDSADGETVKKPNGSSIMDKLQDARLDTMKPGPSSIPMIQPSISILSTALERSSKKRKNEAEPQTPSKKKRGTQQANTEKSKLTFKDIGGMDSVLQNVCQLLVHITHPEVYRQLGISPPRGFLLHGPPGCGKTLLANCIAGELNVPLLKVAAPELVAGVSGESEERIREIFERATVSSPCILFIDEIDAITPNRQFAQKDMERRIVAQLLSCMDDMNKNEAGDRVLVIGATNRPDAIDPALRRAGRFDREVSLGIPDISSRAHILRVVTSKLKLEEGFDFDSLAKYTPGFVGADLMALTREAAMIAVNRVFNEIKDKQRLAQAIAAQAKKPMVATTENDTDIVVDDNTSSSKEEKSEPVVVIDDEKLSCSNLVPSSTTSTLVNSNLDLTPLEQLVSWLHNDAPLNTEQLDALFITAEDFSKALKFVQPSAKREGFATVPDVTWDDVGSLRDIRQELQLSILAPVRHAEQFKALGLTTPTGVLLCGPPGCGKTLLAKAIANEAGINFISVKGPELLNMYVGESERAVRVCFERARNSAPCVIFFDELDALCPKRSDSREGGATMRVVNQMLTEMDGIESRNGVYLLAASNRPDIVDPAVLRPGRLDKILYVGLPTATDRVDILRTITKNGTRPLLAPDVDLEMIGSSSDCDGYTGADLAALVREAGIRALREVIEKGDFVKPPVLTNDHFTDAIRKLRPSVSEKDKEHYAKLKKIYSAREPDVEEMEYY